MAAHCRNYHPIYDQVLNEILAQLERGTQPWIVPWRGGDDNPRNAYTMEYYSGRLNILILWSAAYNSIGSEDHRWLTARQAMLMGGEVRACERGTMIFVGGRAFTKAGDKAAAHKNEVASGYGFQRGYLVFHVSQVEGLPPLRTPLPPSPRDVSPRFQALIASTGVGVRIGGKVALFDEQGDYVQLPDRERFFDPRDLGDWGRTNLHEMAHWAMAPARLNVHPNGPHAAHRHAVRELIAELASAFASRCLDVCPTVEPAAYLAGWLAVMKADSSAIVRVACDAARVADYLLSFDPGP